MVDTPPERFYITRCKNVLEKLVKAMKEKDPNAVITHFEDQHEKSNGHINVLAQKCINSPKQFPISITHDQKVLSKGIPKKLCGAVFTNVVIVHNEEI